MARKTEYPDATRAAVLAFMDVTGANSTRTSEAFDIPRKTVESWLDGVGVNEDVAKIRRIKNEELVAALDERITQMVEALTPDKMQTAPVAQLTTGIGTLIDKTRLIRGESTEITEHREVDHLRDSIQRRLGKGVAARSSNGVAKESPA